MQTSKEMHTWWILRVAQDNSSRLSAPHTIKSTACMLLKSLKCAWGWGEYTAHFWVTSEATSKMSNELTCTFAKQPCNLPVTPACLGDAMQRTTTLELFWNTSPNFCCKNSPVSCYLTQDSVMPISTPPTTLHHCRTTNQRFLHQVLTCISVLPGLNPSTTCPSSVAMLLSATLSLSSTRSVTRSCTLRCTRFWSRPRTSGTWNCAYTSTTEDWKRRWHVMS